jgi:uncharacterized membrane protein YozB (DUF420 family)
MLAAVSTSAMFLVSYLIYHFNVGSVPFRGTGAVRTVYFGILITHTILAMSLPVLVPMAVIRALRSRFDEHKKIARWAFPVWLYVSATGVIIYVMLYRFDWT